VEPRASLECLCSWILFDLEISFILYIYIYIYFVCVCWNKIFTSTKNLLNFIDVVLIAFLSLV
jgi:hypothetical protein